MEGKQFIKTIATGVIGMTTLSAFKNFTKSDLSTRTTALQDKKSKKNGTGISNIWSCSS